MPDFLSSNPGSTTQQLHLGWLKRLNPSVPPFLRLHNADNNGADTTVLLLEIKCLERRVAQRVQHAQVLLLSLFIPSPSIPYLVNSTGTCQVSRK